MNLEDSGQLFILIILLCLSSFFSASETALMSINKIRIRHLVDEGVKGASLIHRLVNNPSKLLSAILVGNNVVNIGASALATSLAIQYFGSSGVGIATGIMTILVLIFGEITPKSLAAQNPEKVSFKVAGLINFISIIVSPISTLLLHTTNMIIVLFGGKIDIKQPFITEEELKTLINIGHEEGVLEGDERQIIHNIFEFGDRMVRDVMTPRMNMVAIDIDSNYDEVIKLFKEQQYSRLPVYRENTDNIVGVLHLKDMFLNDMHSEDFRISKLMREPFFTYESKKLTALFEEMKRKRIPIAIILDEYGGTDGIITMEDLIEELVGDIEDEYDINEDEIEHVNENEYLVEGTTKLSKVNDILEIEFESENYDSIGGFVVGLFGRLPQEGESIEYKNTTLVIEKKEKNRVCKLRVFT